MTYELNIFENALLLWKFQMYPLHAGLLHPHQIENLHLKIHIIKTLTQSISQCLWILCLYCSLLH